MKKIVYIVIIVICMCQNGLAQQTNRNARFERVRDSIFIVENGRRYKADKNIVTVKLKPGINKIGKELKQPPGSA